MLRDLAESSSTPARAMRRCTLVALSDDVLIEVVKLLVASELVSSRKHVVEISFVRIEF
jgi:hypothetical protein